jgi:hypothetical protein
MDDDRVRGANFNQLKDLTAKSKKINQEIIQNMAPATKSFEDLKKIKHLQEKLANRINVIMKSITIISDNITKLYKAKDQCDEQEQKIESLMFKIRGKENEINQKKEDEERNPQSVIKTTNCKGMLLYEDVEEGDGLIGFYYDNENWLGPYKELKSPNINFDWTDGEPIQGVNQDNFSVKWEGWLEVPTTDNYVFTVECDDGAEVFVNDEWIIFHNTGTFVENYKNIMSGVVKADPNDPHGSQENSKPNPFLSVSSPLYLIGNTKVRIMVKYFHSVHTSVYSNNQVFMRLFWQSDDFKKSILPQGFLYSAHFFPPLKITGHNSEEIQLRRLHEEDFAFFNSDKYILQDIPTEFVNDTMLKLKTRYVQDKLEVKANTPTNAYVAYLAHYPNPFNDMDFEDTGLSMSLLQLDKNQGKGSKKLVAKKSARLLIYKKRFVKGLIQIKFNKNGLNAKGIPLIIFFGFDSSEHTPSNCSGREVLVSESTGNHFQKCTSSSDLPNYKCEDGFRNKMRDEEGGMWAANADGVGAWIMVKFSGVFKLTKFQYRNRKNPTERNSQLEISYSSGEKQIVHLKNDDDIVTTNIDSVRADFVKITIKGVYGTLNNGGAFNLFGLSCKSASSNDDEVFNLMSSQVGDGDIQAQTPMDNSEINREKPEDPRKIAPLFQNEAYKPILLNCRDSISNSHKFEQIKLKKNKKIVIKCPESCALYEVPVYGTNVYSKDSAICKSAFHSKKITSAGGLVKMVVLDPIINYKGGLSNGITSQGKYRSQLSLSFEIYEEEDNIVLKPGSKIDMKVTKETGDVWAAGIITGVVDTVNGKFIKYILDGENSRTMELPYKNNKDKIHPCGQHIKNRDCNGSLRRIKKKLPVLIRFVPVGYQSDQDFQSDFGQVFGKNNKPFGWSIDMSSNIRRRLNPSNPLLETIIEFPPSPNSRECIKPNPEKLCEPVSWKVKAGRGKFKVKIYAGDPLHDLLVDLGINNKIIAKNVKIPKNQVEVFEIILETKNGIFEVTSTCEEHCNHAMTKINAVEIIPYDDITDDLNASSNPEKEVCGSSFLGGRCLKDSNVLHCIFDDPSLPSAKFCNGENVLVNIPTDYKCRDQIGQYKCVMVIKYNFIK